MNAYIDELAKNSLPTGILGDADTLSAIRKNVILPQSARVLELGTAGGSFALALADILQAQVLAVDSHVGMIELAKKRVAEFVHSGNIDVLHMDVFDPALNSQGPFDVVAHRGLESFVTDRQALIRRAYSLLRPWGYLINVTHTYEGSYDQACIDALNVSMGSRIKPVSSGQLVEEYRAEGFRLVSATKVPSRVAIGQLPDDLIEIGKLIQENEMSTSAYVVILRKGSELNLFSSSDLLKG